MLENILWAIGGFIIVLTPIVLVHELGHFWAARYFNIRVDEFGLGLPPRAMVLTKRNGTIYSLNWIPLGGFVRPAGEDDPSVEGGLAGASKRARFVVLIAGATANLVMAVIVFWVALMIGTPELGVSIADVNPDSPAMEAGLLAGDVIVSVNGAEAVDTATVAAPMYENAGQSVEMIVERDGQLLTLAIVPRLPGEYDTAVEGPIGIGLSTFLSGVRIRRRPIEAAVDAFGSCGLRSSDVLGAAARTM